MRLPALRLAYLRGAAALRELLGSVLVLPADLPEAEHEDLCDLLALGLALPVRVSARATALPRGHLCVLTEPVTEDPAPVDDGFVLAVRAPEPGRRRLGLSRDLRRLRDLALAAVVRGADDSRLDTIVTWAQEATDSPSTALRFASAAYGEHLASPFAADALLAREGLAATIAWLLRGVDPRVAEWVLARAVPSKNPGRLVSTEAALLGESAALQRAFAHGLIEHLPERRDDPDELLDLRRPFALLGQLGDLSAPLEIPSIAATLRPRLDAAVWHVFETLLQDRPPPLRLAPPLPPTLLVGREEMIARLRSLLEPGHEVRTVVLYGAAGMGKTAVAATVCQRLASRMEPVWLTFAGGAEAAWQRVADGLRVETTGRPRGNWLAQVQRMLADRDALLVLDDVDAVPETEMATWLPRGEGSLVTLVLSTRPLRVLERERDAVAVMLAAPGHEEAKELLARLVPGIKAAVESGAADALLYQLGGQPQAVRMAASLLEKRSLVEVGALVEGPQALRGLAGPALAALGAEDKAVVEALAVGAKTGSARALVARMVGVEDVGAVLGRLAERGLVDLGERTARLVGVVRQVAEGEVAEGRRRELEVRHAEAAEAAMEEVREARDVEGEDEAYPDALLALRRMTERCRAGDGAVAKTVRGLAFEVKAYPRGSRIESVSAAIVGWEALLGVWTREERPEDWARAQMGLGAALIDLPAGNRAENVHRALGALEEALTVYAKEKTPRGWAAAQLNLGNALCELPTGDRAENLRRAIAAYEASLTVNTRESTPEDWAWAQNGLGNAFSALQDQPRAIAAFEAALQVRTRESNPYGWATVQNNLGIALVREGPENLRRAVEAYEAALTVFTRGTYPEDWAMAQNNLGNTLGALTDGDRSENLGKAIDAYTAALTVRTREAFPWDWAQTQRNLGLTMVDLPTGSRRRNLETAVESFRAALTIYTEADFPRQHANTQANLDDALRALAALGPPSEPAPPP